MMSILGTRLTATLYSKSLNNLLMEAFMKWLWIAVIIILAFSESQAQKKSKSKILSNTNSIVLAESKKPGELSKEKAEAENNYYKLLNEFPDWQLAGEVVGTKGHAPTEIRKSIYKNQPVIGIKTNQRAFAKIFLADVKTLQDLTALFQEMGKNPSLKRGVVAGLFGVYLIIEKEADSNKISFSKSKEGYLFDSTSLSKSDFENCRKLLDAVLKKVQ
jgi:hypothetical protein